MFNGTGSKITDSVEAGSRQDDMGPVSIHYTNIKQVYLVNVEHCGGECGMHSTGALYCFIITKALPVKWETFEGENFGKFCSYVAIYISFLCKIWGDGIHCTGKNWRLI